MGGSVGGQIASKLVLDNAFKIIGEEYNYELHPEEMKGILQRVFVASQQAIAQKIKKEPSLTGMGTTLTCVLIQDDKYVWGNIGDSRTYLLCNNDLKLITVDHTYVQDFIKETDGKDLPQSVLKQYGNYLQRALDGGTDQADIFPQDKDFEQLAEGDIFLLCSDGLIIDKVQSDTTVFKDYILGSKNLEIAAEQLIALAFHDGSNDNISAVLASFGSYKRMKTKIKKFAYPPKEKVKREQKRKFRFPRLSTLIGASAILVTMLLAYVLIIKPDQQKLIDKIIFWEKDKIESEARNNKQSNSESVKNISKNIPAKKNVNELAITKKEEKATTDRIPKEGEKSRREIDKPKGFIKANNEVIKTEQEINVKEGQIISTPTKTEEPKKVEISNSGQNITQVQKIEEPNKLDPLDSLIEKGKKLESEMKYYEAKTIYSKALKSAPLNRKKDITDLIININKISQKDTK
jgi:protein phosphatase